MSDNVFKKADQRKRVVPGGTQNVSEPSETEESVITPSVAEESVGDKIIKKKRVKKKSYSLYLSDEVHKELQKRSKQAGGMSVSEYLDEYLRLEFKL